MSEVFPFGFPPATSLYLGLYAGTLIAHLLFMHYVLAGTAYLTVGALFRANPQDEGVFAALLRDWLPFMLSAAITAGVAPLLFVQILYQERFYTANLLLFHRWMAVVPALIAGFYLLYLVKADTFGTRARIWRPIACGGALLCFAFTAWSWTENHVLSLQSQRTWSAHYAASSMMHHSWEIWPRLGLWIAAAFPTLAVVLAWQTRLTDRYRGRDLGSDTERPSLLAYGGMAMMLGCGAAYLILLPPTVREVVISPMALPYAAAILVGMLLQGIGWWPELRGAQRRPGKGGAAADAAGGPYGPKRLAMILCGVALTLVGLVVVRESIRLAMIDGSIPYEAHQQAANVGGLAVFGVFLGVNLLLIIFCFWLVRRNLHPSPAPAKPQSKPVKAAQK